MIDVREAVKIAREYVEELYEGMALNGFALEEVELAEDEKYWLITFGYDTERPTEYEGALVAALSAYRPKFVRDYKVVKLSAENGHVVSMKIREL